jgi:hypothetical protein
MCWEEEEEEEADGMQTDEREVESKPVDESDDVGRKSADVFESEDDDEESCLLLRGLFFWEANPFVSQGFRYCFNDVIKFIFLLKFFFSSSSLSNFSVFNLTNSTGDL